MSYLDAVKAITDDALADFRTKTSDALAELERRLGMLPPDVRSRLTTALIDTINSRESILAKHTLRILSK